MPLYMDFHKIENVTIDEVQSAHTADESIQEQYGVKYHQFWVNQKEGTVFCLVEGPDAKTCELVHQLAHGNLACAMAEVEPGSFTLFMGEKLTVDHGLTRSEDGDIDDGYRFLLVASVRGIIIPNKSGDFRGLQIPWPVRDKVLEIIKANRGRTKKWETDDMFIGVFNEAEDAIKCAEKIREELLGGNERQVIFKIGISADQPVTHDGKFFSKAIRLGQRLCLAANENQILVSALATKLSIALKTSSQVKFLDIPEEEFIFGFLDITDNKLAQENFNVASICKDIGISRPQLYRKITALTGRAPNDFLRDLRLEKSLTLLKQRTRNISQVALEVGYSNPSYFSKCFAEKFGCLPSEVVTLSNR
jgi:AraC-like DNA-binding protein